MMKKLGLIFVLIYSLVYISNAQTTPPPVPEGALISVEINGLVGILLNDLSGSLRASARSYALNNLTDAAWTEMCKQQTLLHINKLASRPFVDGKSTLHLPPREQWQFTFTSAPRSITYQSKSYVVRNYTYYGVLYGRADSVYESEPILTTIGGVYETFTIIPLDPYYLFYRLGFSCTFRVSNNIDTRTYYFFYDETMPNCQSNLTQKSGSITLNLKFTRLPWSQTVANQWKFSDYTSEGADLTQFGSILSRDVQIVYKYFTNTACVLTEGSPTLGGQGGCIEKPGWRRLLEFTSSGCNTGKKNLLVGSVRSEEILSKGLFYYDPCHDHYHIEHYGTFELNGTNGVSKGRKTGFCLISTTRYVQGPFTSFGTDFYSCKYQGISAGWCDDYFAGIECQWFDISNVTGGAYTLSNTVNPDSVLCEGDLQYDANGTQLWEPTNYTFNGSQTVFKQKCNVGPNYYANNKLSINVDVANTGAAITQPCTNNGYLNKMKECGFSLVKNENFCSPKPCSLEYFRCQPGVSTTVKFIRSYSSCPTGNCLTIIRVCPWSFDLNGPVYCEHQRSIASQVFQTSSGFEYSFTFVCPTALTTTEQGGRFVLLQNNIRSTDPNPDVTVVNVLPWA